MDEKCIECGDDATRIYVDRKKRKVVRVCCKCQEDLMGFDEK